MVSTFLMKENYSIDPVTDLKALARSLKINFQSAHLLPHGFE